MDSTVVPDLYGEPGFWVGRGKSVTRCRCKSWVVGILRIRTESIAFVLCGGRMCGGAEAEVLTRVVKHSTSRSRDVGSGVGRRTYRGRESPKQCRFNCGSLKRQGFLLGPGWRLAMPFTLSARPPTTFPNLARNLSRAQPSRSHLTTLISNKPSGNLTRTTISALRIVPSFSPLQHHRTHRPS